MNLADQHKGACILVVEDDELLRRSLVTFLASLGYRPLVAGSGEEALVQTGQNRVDAVVTDLHLPLMSGIELAETLRTCGRPLPTILISGFLNESIRERARNAEIPVVLGKPAELTLLATHIGSLLSPPEDPSR
jgi:two-component system, OmpR family, sensor histidine kinase TorS